MAEKKTSIKHIEIDKNQSQVLAIIVGAVIITVFSLFATKALVSKGLYQRRALHARQQAVNQLKKNYDSAQTLFNQYKVFASEDPNIIGGSVSGSTDKDGDNAKIVLDALPSTYDAPALASSLEKLMNGRGVKIDSISVTDDPTTNSDQPQDNPQSKAVQFSFSGTSNYQLSKALLQDFEHSIRPFDLNTLEIDGSDNNLKLTVGMTTYFQPAKSLDLKPTKEVK
jgi:hypothetical protein